MQICLSENYVTRNGRAKCNRVKDTTTENCHSLNTPYRLFGEGLDNVTIYVTRHGKL
jgi:hypothetical protein